MILNTRSRASPAIHLLIAYHLLTCCLCTDHGNIERPLLHERLEQPQPFDSAGREGRSGDLDSGYNDALKRYIPDFVGISRGIIGRAADDIEKLGNNKPFSGNVSIGQTQHYSFPKESLTVPKSPLPSMTGFPFLQRKEESGDFVEEDYSRTVKRQDHVELFISMNVCKRPDALQDQLTIYISNSSSNTKPDDSNNVAKIVAEGGFLQTSIQTTDSVYISVEAPAHSGSSGTYEYELTASIDSAYAIYPPPGKELNFSVFWDSDNNNALLYTNNLTANRSDSRFNDLLVGKPIFSMFVQNQDNRSWAGLEKSLCALKGFAQIQGPEHIETRMTDITDGLVRQEFYVKDLNASSTYMAILAIDGNSTSAAGVVQGGGAVYPSITFTTKSDNICAIIRNLEFCKDVGYAVPTNPGNDKLKNLTELGNIYDRYAKNAYEAFSKSLQQIPCDTTSSAQYSLARNCSDCDNAYKRWLCAVKIPRCEDFSNTAGYLIPRNNNQAFHNDTLRTLYGDDRTLSADNKSVLAFNSSRNLKIDEEIQPGPYKEKLPCETLCHELVQSCPAALQFACPLEGFGLNFTYGKKDFCNSLRLPKRESKAASLKKLASFGVVLTFLSMLSAAIG